MHEKFGKLDVESLSLGKFGKIGKAHTPQSGPKKQTHEFVEKRENRVCAYTLLLNTNTYSNMRGKFFPFPTRHR